jgi:peptidoglycan hydrolase-like protein with peptidoglycan-binding domain
MMKPRALVALLVMTAMMIGTAGPALASPDGEIVVKKGESSDNVILLQLRLRDLGYYNYKITGYCGDFTVASVKEFQKVNGISTDGVAGQKTLDVMYSNSAKRKPVTPRIKPKTVKRKTTKYRYGNLRDWYDYVNSRFRRNTRYKVVDFDTGLSYYVIRVGGSKHADVAPATKSDTNTMYITLGRSWNNWERRALIVYINGEPIAASLYGEPHGSTGVPGNGMNLPDGKLQQVCIHFLNSKTHGSNHVDPGHQAQIRRAAGR